jgi:ATP-dependent RNA helicase RhlE
MLRNPASVEIGQRNVAAPKIEQTIYNVEKSRKRDVLSWLIGSRNWPQVLVFTRTKHGANRLAEQLEQDGLRAAAIHGNKSQGARTRALADFKSGAVRVLVATDIAARGIDIDELPNVVNYELPEVPEHYVHRIGRTGRAGNEGHAVSLVTADERPLLKQIERLLGRQLAVGSLDGAPPPRPREAQPAAEHRHRDRERHGQRPQHGHGQRSGNGQQRQQHDAQRNAHGGQRSSHGGDQRGSQGQPGDRRGRSHGGRRRPAAARGAQQR